MRPSLNDQLSAEQFQAFRWHKAELIDFCRERGLPTDGTKHHIRRQVARYLAAQRTLHRDTQS